MTRGKTASQNEFKMIDQPAVPDVHYTKML